MKKYRIKLEAHPFFKEKYRMVIESLEYFTTRNISIDALEEVEPVNISYGWKTSDIHTTLSEWGNEGAKAHLTVNFPLLDGRDYDKMRENFKELIPGIQDVAKKWYNEQQSK